MVKNKRRAGWFGCPVSLQSGGVRSPLGRSYGICFGRVSGISQRSQHCSSRGQPHSSRDHAYCAFSFSSVSSEGSFRVVWCLELCGSPARHGCARPCPSPQHQFLTAREDGDFRPVSQTRRPIIQTIWVCMGPFELRGNHRWRIPVVPEAFSVK